MDQAVFAGTRDGEVAASRWTRPRVRAFLAAILTSIIAGACVLTTFIAGQRRGMDHAVEFGPDRVQVAISIALSDLVYHLDAGYLGYAKVRDRLLEVWNRDAHGPNDPIVIQNSHNSAVLNDAIHAAASLGPQLPGYVTERSLFPAFHDDVGLVDYVKTSFRIFGYRIESLYDTFFLLLAISAAAYILAFWDDMTALFMLVLLLFCFRITLDTTILSIPAPSFSASRSCSTLALLPMWHLVLLLIRRHRASMAQVLLALTQIGIFILIIAARGTARWDTIFVVAVAIALALIELRPQWPRPWLPALIHRAGRWPLLLLLGGLLAHGTYIRSALHPAYFTDDVLRYHGIWEPSFSGLGYEPDLWFGFGGVWDDPGLPPRLDAIPRDFENFVAGAKYLDAIRFTPLPSEFPKAFPPAYLSTWGEGLKWGFHEEVSRRMFLYAISHHPLLTLKLYLIDKPYHLLVSLGQIVAQSPLAWLWWTIVGASTAFIAFWLGPRPLATGELRRAILLIAAALPFASIPNLAVFSLPYVMADFVFVLTMLVQAVVCAVFVEAWRMRRPVKPGASHTGPSTSALQGS
jgi:hypothetical protein